MNPNNQAYYSSPGDPNKKKRLIVIAGLVVVVLIAIAYLIFGGNNTPNSPNNNDEDEATESVELTLASLDDPSFVTPDMKGYIKRSDFTIDVGDYTTSDNSCNVQFGVVPSAELPGLTSEDIAATHLGATEEAGAENAEPKEGDDLVLSEEKGSTKYTLSTWNFDYRRDNINYKASYSIVLLKENRRAYVRYYCANDSGPISSQDFKKIQDKAKQIKVRVE
jgi:hypothetical protein